MFKLEEAKTEIALKKKGIQIINDMEKYDANNEEYFTFPRFKKFQSGIYDENFNPIFSLIESRDIAYLSTGYNKIKSRRAFVYEFKTKRYFQARYLVIMTEFDNLTIIKNMVIVMMSIAVVTFILSFIILKNFAKPFKQMNESLDGFIKDSMHEINTPLSIININIDMYNEKFGKNKYFSRIKSASKILSTIYNDMNYLIKEQTINTAPKKEIDFSFFVRKSIDYFKDVAELKGIKIIPKIEDNHFISFVPAKLQKIVDNTLSNAIKYGKEEKDVVVMLHQRGNKVVLSIQDFGIGIKEPDKIFSRYYREDDTKGGFGIGLNIVNKIINDDNIKVNVYSELNVGSTFEYWFEPLQKWTTECFP